MKALTIRQPWVYAILRAGKDIENRSWQRAYRGWIAIHASASPSRHVSFPLGVRCPSLETLDYSAICGVARVVDIVTKSRSKWFWRPDDGSTNYGWVLANVCALPRPIPCKGTLLLWDVPPKVEKEMRRQLSTIEALPAAWSCS